MSAWIDHVKRFQKMHGCSYKEALKGASATYQRGSGLMSRPDLSNPQYHTTGGNLKNLVKQHSFVLLRH